MAALLQAERLRERLVRGFVAPDRAGAGRRFQLAGETIALEEAASAGHGDVVAVPTEQVLMLPVDLPLPTARKRLEALPFAIEDRIADPLEAVHVALGAEIAPRRYLAAVVRHGAMRDWIAAVEASDAPAAALVPDALLLPVPAIGWSIGISDERALVRDADGTGFAIARSQLPIAWAAAGRPAAVAWSGGVPAELGALPGDPTMATTGAVPIDLRQGLHAYRRPALSGLRQKALTIAAAGILAHGLIAAADTLVLRHQAHARAVQTQALIAAAMPGIATGDDAISAAAASLPMSVRAGAPDPLLPLLARVAAASGPLAMTRLDYDRQGQRLLLTVEPGSEAGIVAKLSAAGLAPSAGPGNVVVRGAGA